MDMNVILGTSADYLPFTATTIASVCHHIVDGSGVSFHIMHAGDVTAPEIDRFRANLDAFSDRGTFEFVKVEDSLNLARRISTSAHIKGAATYLRLYIPDLFKGRFTRAVYLDSDLVVCRNLGMLHRQDMHGCGIAGVEDYRSLVKLDSLWLPLSDKYVNAGVLLLDLDAIDQREMLDRLDRVASSLIKYMINMGDQDLLSLLFHDRLVYLDPHWNVLIFNEPGWRALLLEQAGGMNRQSREVMDDCVADPFIIHYIGKVKPWTRNWYHDPHSVRWYDYARMTGYFDKKMENVEERMWWLGPIGRAVDLGSSLPRALGFRKTGSAPAHLAGYSPIGNAPGRDRSRLDSLLRRNATNRRKATRGFREGNPDGAGEPIYFLSNPADYRMNGIKCFIRPLLQSTQLIPILEANPKGIPGTILLDSLDLGVTRKKIKRMEKCVASGFRLAMLEPGPISTILERCPLPGIPARYRRRHSLRLDAAAFSFDTRAHSNFIDFLDSSDSDITDSARARCRKAIDYIVAERLSISNSLPIDTKGVPGVRDGAVLVVDQGKGDPAVLRSHADTGVFSRMLASALKENPGAEIHVYLSGLGAEGHLGSLPRQENLHRIPGQVNPYELLAGIEKVYTCNSHLGFEALLAGKRVTTFADSFYSGWGLTEDRNTAIIRRRRHGLESLFHAVAFENVVYFSPFAPEQVELEQFLEEMAKLRDEFLGWASRWK